MKKICHVTPLISIWVDELQYIVRIQKIESQLYKHAECRYFTSLETCFQDVFDLLCKQNLCRANITVLTEVVDVILKTKEEIRLIVEPFLHFSLTIKSRSNSAQVGQAALSSYESQGEEVL